MQQGAAENTRAQWSSEPAFIFSMAAAAVGLGNLWRFPYIAGENGGAVFIIAYFIALIVVTLPIMILEVAAGRYSEGNTVHTFRKIHPFARYYGWFVVLLTVVITSYYLVITGWTLGYSVDALRGELVQFRNFTEGYNSLYFFLAIILLTSLILIRGLSALEKFSKFLMPLLLLVIIGLVFTASRTDGWEQAKDFLLNPDFSRMTDLRLWMMAFGQAFYTLAIGQGYLVTYGSYIPRNVHLPRACITVGLFESGIALLAGWMIFPFVFSHGLQPDEGSQLAFTTLPRVFQGMAGGGWLAILFFLLFFFAAFSSSLAGLKVIVSAVEEEFRLNIRTAVGIVAGLMLVLGLPSALSFSPMNVSVGDTPFLDWIDQFVGGQVILFSGILGAGLIAWLVPPAKMRTVLGTETRWWEWRMYLVGRWLPVVTMVWLAWLLLFA